MPIFGDNSAGTQTHNASGNRAYLDRFTLSEAGTADSISIYFASGSAGIGVKGLIYSDSGGSPGSLVAVSAAGSTAGGAGWMTLAFAGESLAEGNYWIGGVTNNFGCAFGSDTTGDAPNVAMANGTLTYATPQSTWPGTSVSYSTRLNVYVTYTASASGPAVSSVSDTTPAHGSSLTITGTNFGATQGAGTVDIEGDEQTVTSWSDTSITITVDRGLSKYGVAVDLVVTDDAAAASDPFALTSLTPPSGWAYIDLTTPNATADNRITATADLASGDQLAYETVSGTVDVFADATFSVSGATTEFDVEVWTSPDGWGAVATQTLSSATIISVDGTSAASGQAAAAAVALAQASGATTAAGQAAAAAAARAASSAASDAAGQASGAIVALAAADGAADAAAQAAAGAVLVGMADGSSQATQPAAAPAAAVASSTGAAAGAGQAAAAAMAVAAADGSSAAPAPASATAGAISSAAGASAAPAQAVGDTGASTVVAVDGTSAAASQSAAAAFAISAAAGAAAAPAPAAAPVVAIAAVSAASQAPAQAAAEPGSGSIVAVDGASYGAAPAAAAVRAIASAAASGAALGQAAAEILATASVDGVAQAAAQASAEAVGRITIAVDGASAAPGQAASPQGEDVVPPPPVPQQGGGGRLVTPSYKLPKKLRKRRIVAVDAVAASSSAHATASVAAIVAVAGASAAAAQHGTAELPVGSMVADQWLAARMQELEFERTMLEHI